MLNDEFTWLFKEISINWWPYELQKDKSIDTYIFKGEKEKKKITRFDKKENPFNKLLSKYKIDE